jgi:hypothetical protein
MSFLGRLFRRDPDRQKLDRHKRELGERKEYLRSEEIKLNLALRDLEELKKFEEELLDRGKSEDSQISKRTVAFKIKGVREKQKGLESRIGIYDNRIRVLREQISSLETLVEAGSAGLPDEKQIEEASFEASRKLEQLNNLLLKVEGTRPEAERQDDEVEAILKEFDARADRELKRAELDATRRPPPEKDSSVTEAELDEPERE